MRKLYLFLLILTAFCAGCHWQSDTTGQQAPDTGINIDRFDRVESLYLTVADFAALRQMQTDYPQQLRTLIEDVLKLGPVNSPDINTRFLVFFQDSTLQTLIADVAETYADMDDVSEQLDHAFQRLSKMLPDVTVPAVYAQIGSLDQSIVVGDSLLGISLDKYLGADHPVYIRYGYTEQQRQMMTREYIVPDCLGFYLLSHYPLEQPDSLTDMQRHWHMAKIQFVVNQAMGRNVFHDDFIDQLERYHKAHSHQPMADILGLDSL